MDKNNKVCIDKNLFFVGLIFIFLIGVFVFINKSLTQKYALSSWAAGINQPWKPALAPNQYTAEEGWMTITTSSGDKIYLAEVRNGKIVVQSSDPCHQYYDSITPGYPDEYGDSQYCGGKTVIYYSTSNKKYFLNQFLNNGTYTQTNIINPKTETKITLSNNLRLITYDTNSSRPRVPSARIPAWGWLNKKITMKGVSYNLFIRENNNFSDYKQCHFFNYDKYIGNPQVTLPCKNVTMTYYLIGQKSIFVNQVTNNGDHLSSEVLPNIEMNIYIKNNAVILGHDPIKGSANPLYFLGNKTTEDGWGMIRTTEGYTFYIAELYQDGQIKKYSAVPGPCHSYKINGDVLCKGKTIVYYSTTSKTIHVRQFIAGSATAAHKTDLLPGVLTNILIDKNVTTVTYDTNY